MKNYIFLIILILIFLISLYYSKKNILGFSLCYNLTNKNLPPDYNFNPGIIIYENNKYSNIIKTNNYNCKFVFRNNQYNSYYYNSKIYEANFDINKYNLYNIKLKYNNNYGYEDPRLFSFDNKLFISMTKLNKTTLISKVVVLEYDNESNIEYNFNYLNNIKGINHKEKNWQFFQHYNKYYILYVLLSYTKLIKILIL